MPIDTQAKKILGGAWASDTNAERADPESFGVDRTDGWPVRYEQPGSGFEPEREVFNQRFRELDGFAVQAMREGLPFAWDPDVDYVAGAFVRSNDGRLYVSSVPTGPMTGNATDPTAAGAAAIWNLY